MKAKIVRLNKSPRVTNSGKINRKLSKSKISTLMNKISQHYKDEGSQGYFNYPGFQKQ